MKLNFPAAFVLALVIPACGQDDPARVSDLPASPAARPAATQAEPAPAPAAAEPEVPEAAAGITADDVAYGITEDSNLIGHIVLPADAIDLPAILLIHEWWGLNDDVRALAQRLAAEGYAVLAVDLFGGETASTSADAEALMSKHLEDTEAVLDNLRQAHAYLDNFVLPTRIAVIGFALGGGWALEAAIDLGDDVDAVVNFYGRITTGPNVLSGLEAPILGVFAQRDEAIPAREVQRFRTVLRDLDKTEQVVIYPDVSPGFALPGGSAYDAVAAEEAWNEMLEFLSEHLD